MVSHSTLDKREGFLSTSAAWRAAYPGAHAGVLAVRGVANTSGNDALDTRKREIENSLRLQFAGQDRTTLRKQPILKAYEAYYKRFNKTYHVLLQVESIIFKNKPIPSSTILVEAMFMAEVESMLLTAGHDLDAIRAPLTLNVAKGTEEYVLLRDTPQVAKSGDMMISDSQGVISSVLYGPDKRTRITSQTTNAIFTVYAPAGISASSVDRHLEEIRRNVQLVSPSVQVDLKRVYTAS